MEYKVYGDTLITFVKIKIEKMVPGLIRAGFWGISGKLNIYHAAKILFLKIEELNMITL